MFFELLNRKKVLVTLKNGDLWSLDRAGPCLDSSFQPRNPLSMCHMSQPLSFVLCVCPPRRCGCPRCFDFPFFCWSAAMRLPKSLRSRRRDIVGGEQGTEFFKNTGKAIRCRCAAKSRKGVVNFERSDHEQEALTLDKIK